MQYRSLEVDRFARRNWYIRPAKWSIFHQILSVLLLNRHRCHALTLQWFSTKLEDQMHQNVCPDPRASPVVNATIKKQSYSSKCNMPRGNCGRSPHFPPPKGRGRVFNQLFLILSVLVWTRRNRCDAHGNHCLPRPSTAGDVHRLVIVDSSQSRE